MYSFKQIFTGFGSVGMLMLMLGLLSLFSPANVLASQVELGIWERQTHVAASTPPSPLAAEGRGQINSVFAVDRANHRICMRLIRGFFCEPSPEPVWDPWANIHPETGLPMTREGWSDLLALYQHPEHYLDSRIIYVSVQQGDDATARVYSPSDAEVGFDPFQPLGPVAAFASLNQAYRELRHGYPDLLLLHRGENYSEPLSQGSGGRWQKGGRSSMEPLIVATWDEGSERPRLSPPRYALHVYGGGGSPETLDFLIFSGFEIYGEHRDPELPSYIDANDGDQPAAGIRWLLPGTQVLFEDLRLRFAHFIFDIQGNQMLQGLAVRRSVFERNYGIAGVYHAQGMYATRIDGLLIEESIFHQNGKNADIPNAQATIFNHHLYLQTSNFDVVVRGNILSDPSSHGVQLRSGGVLDDNLFLNVPLAGFIGGAGGWMSRNVVLGGADISSSLPRGWGLEVNTHQAVNVTDNLVANKSLGVGSGMAYRLPAKSPEPIQPNSLFAGNVAYGWTGTALHIAGEPTYQGHWLLEQNQLLQLDTSAPLIRIDNPPEDDDTIRWFGNRYGGEPAGQASVRIGAANYSLPQWLALTGGSEMAPRDAFPDPERGIETYQASLGEEPTLVAFLASALEQSRSNWRPEYTAAAVNNYIRAGFGWPLP